MLIPAAILMLALFQAPPPPQMNGCDVNADGQVNVVDVQVLINTALGVLACPIPAPAGTPGTVTLPAGTYYFGPGIIVISNPTQSIGWIQLDTAWLNLYYTHK